MKKNIVLFSLIMLIICSFLFIIKKEEKNINVIYVTILTNDGEFLTLEDDNHFIYQVKKNILNEELGSRIVLEYANLKDNEIEDVLSYEVISENKNTIPSNYLDNGIFSDYYVMAYNKLNTMSLDEKINQILLVKLPSDYVNVTKDYQFAGYVFYENNFKNKNKNEVIKMIDDINKVSKIPLLMVTDEEGGKVVRISSNNKLRSTPFKSSQALYQEGGLPLIKSDTIEKSNLLYDLGINVNLAPVVDITDDPNSYIYDRTLKENNIITSEYAKTVINASKNTGVSYILKHFPGYANNIDTHTWVSIDNRTNEEIESDLLPFIEGIKSGAEGIMVSHNIVNSIDSSNPASLSINVHNLLRNDLSFTGVIITDDIEMSSLDNVSNKTIKALVSGNDLIITGDYLSSIKEIQNALINNTISEELIDMHVFRVLAWKYYKGMMIDEK